MDNVYTERPTRIAMAASGWEEFQRLRAEYGDSTTAAMDYIIDLHVEHVRKMIAADILGADGTLIVTDIPDFDLSLIDANFPIFRQRQCTLTSKAGASIIVNALTRLRKGIVPIRH